MKNAVIIAVFLGIMLFAPCPMRFDGTVLQKDCIFKSRINIKSKTGEMKGWMKKDLFLPNRINVYDKYGNKKGFLVRDTLNPDTLSFNKVR